MVLALHQPCLDTRRLLAFLLFNVDDHQAFTRRGGLGELQTDEPTELEQLVCVVSLLQDSEVLLRRLQSGLPISAIGHYCILIELIT